MDQSELKRRLEFLGASFADRLTNEQRGWFAEFVMSGEYGLALEMLADWLSEDEQPITARERKEAEDLSRAMGNSDRVIGPLALCP